MSTNEELYMSEDMIKAHKKLEAKKKREAKGKKEEDKKKNAVAKKKREKDGKIVEALDAVQSGTMEIFSEMKCPSCGPVDKYVLTGSARAQRIINIKGEVLDQTTFWDTFSKDKYRCMICGDQVSGKVAAP